MGTESQVSETPPGDTQHDGFQLFLTDGQREGRATASVTGIISVIITYKNADILIGP